MPDGNDVSANDQARAGGRDYSERCDQRRYGMYLQGSNNIQLGAGASLVNVLRPCPDCRVKLLIDGERACPHCRQRRSEDQLVGFVSTIAGAWIGCCGIVLAFADLVGMDPSPASVIVSAAVLELLGGLGLTALWMRRAL